MRLASRRGRPFASAATRGGHGYAAPLISMMLRSGSSRKSWGNRRGRSGGP